MNKIKEIIKPHLKPIIGLLLFYGIQLFGTLPFQNIINKNIYIDQIILLGIELVLLIIFILMNKTKLKKDYNDFNKNYKKYLLYAFKAWFIGIIIMYASNILINMYITEDIAANEQVDRTILTMYPIYAIFAMIPIGPFVEELVFRGNFKETYKHDLTFIIVTSLLFAGAHVSTGFNSLTDLVYLIPYGSLSVAFALIYTKTNNIYTSIITHTLHNTISVCILVLATSSGLI